MWLFIEPADVLFFRTSRPFNAGESGYLTSLFPPTPETIQGALRARIAATFAAEWGVSLAEAFSDSRELSPLIGNEKGGYGRFRLRGWTLGRREKEDQRKIAPLFPPPAHLLRSEERDEAGRHMVARLIPTLDDSVITNWPDGFAHLRLLQREETSRDATPHAAMSGHTKKFVDFDHWLTANGLRLALSGGSAWQQLRMPKENKPDKSAPSPDEPPADAVAPDDLFVYESRLGIGMSNNTKTTKEGLLYQIGVVRLKAGVGLLVDVGLEGCPPEKIQETLKLEKKGWLALGGERRAASYEVLETSPIDSSLELAGGARPCLYFVTPAYFKRGWQPESWETLVGAKPVAAAVSRAQLIGGWRQQPKDAGGGPKPLRRCVPAGSVYFFDDPITKSGPFTDEGSEIGYGIAYKGAWEHV